MNEPARVGQGMRRQVEDVLETVARGKRGRLKLYLGFAAGVGKTYRMLEEAHALRARRVDVVAGFIECHGRAETERLLAGLDQVPLRCLGHRGVEIGEMDLDAVLERKPDVALVDELAHTNVPGSRNRKRYQDVRELLAAGIDVLSALNVQHLESLKDVVERATGLVIRETVPDGFLKEADEVVCLDLAVEELHERLRSGKIHGPDKIEDALAHVFKRESLTRLRELALREVAERVGAADAQRGGTGAATRVMVCLSSASPRGATLVRKGSRLAERLGTEWFVVFVETSREAPRQLDADTQRRLMAHTGLARELGAEIVHVRERDPVEALLTFARSHAVAHIVVGRSHEAAWRQWLGRSVPLRLVRQAQGFDVHVVATDEEDGSAVTRTKTTAEGRR